MSDNRVGRNRFNYQLILAKISIFDQKDYGKKFRYFSAKMKFLTNGISISLEISIFDQNFDFLQREAPHNENYILLLLLVYCFFSVKSLTV